MKINIFIQLKFKSEVKMKKIRRVHFNADGNVVAKLCFFVDDEISVSDFVKTYENELFLYFDGEFSAIVDNLNAEKIVGGEKRFKAPTLTVTLRCRKLKKTYLVESVTCEIGRKKLYKSRIIHVFSKKSGEFVYHGTAKKTNAENPVDSFDI